MSLARFYPVSRAVLTSLLCLLVVTGAGGTSEATRRSEAYSQIAIAGTRAYVTDAGDLLAIDLQFNAVVWRLMRSQGDAVVRVGVSNDLLLALIQRRDEEVKLERLFPESGAVLWSAKLPPQGRTSVFRSCGPAVITTDYFSGAAIGYDIANGQSLWNTASSRKYLFQPPVVRGDKAYFVSKTSEEDLPSAVVELDCRSGIIARETPVHLPGVWETPLLEHDGHFLLVSFDKRKGFEVQQVDSGSGKLLWNFKTRTALLVSYDQKGDALIVARHVTLINRQTGQPREVLRLQREPLDSAISGDRLIIREDGKMLTAINIETGERIWKLQLSGEPTSRIAAGPDYICVRVSADLLVINATTGKLVGQIPLTSSTPAK